VTIPPFRVYLFDIDGTLLDSAQDICGAVQQALSSHPCPPCEFDYLKSFIGRHLIDLFSEVLPHYTPAQMDELVESYRTIYRGRGHTMTKLYPGVVEGLAALGGRKATATTKGTPTTRAVLEQFGLLPFFDHVQGTDGFPCKPAPDVIFTALKGLGAEPSDCLFVGDSCADMEAGKRAGVKTCAVRYGYGRIDQLAQFSPDYWVDDLRELTGFTLLRPLHKSEALNRVKLDVFDKWSDEALVHSLSPGQRDSLKARADGTLLDGHHRLQVLRLRGVDVESLPREIVDKAEASS
jgi:HAD superfamily hydrolase (TIGR01509 family)